MWLESIIYVAINDDDAEMRRISLNLLTNRPWRVNTNNIQLFLDGLSIAIHDSQEQVRAAALEALEEITIIEERDMHAQLGRYAAQRAASIADVAATDPSPALRSRALQLLEVLER